MPEPVKICSDAWSKHALYALSNLNLPCRFRNEVPCQTMRIHSHALCPQFQVIGTRLVERLMTRFPYFNSSRRGDATLAATSATTSWHPPILPRIEHWTSKYVTFGLNQHQGAKHCRIFPMLLLALTNAAFATALQITHVVPTITVLLLSTRHWDGIHDAI
jgi:hypothetical protein